MVLISIVIVGFTATPGFDKMVDSPYKLQLLISIVIVVLTAWPGFDKMVDIPY